MSKITLYFHSFFWQFVRNSLYHKLIIGTFILTTALSLWAYSSNFINLIGAITATLALFIWFGDLNRSWRQSLNNRLTVFYLAPEQETQFDDPKEDNKTPIKYQVVACYVRAHVEGNGDIRALAQQLSTQLITQYIESLKLKLKFPTIRLKIDTGGIDIYHHSNPVHLPNDKNKVEFVNDIVAIVKLNKFSSDLKTEWCPIKDKDNADILSKSQLLQTDHHSFLLASIGEPARDDELKTLSNLNEQFPPFSHINQRVEEILSQSTNE
jgi:hypothetical protein